MAEIDKAQKRLLRKAERERRRKAFGQLAVGLRKAHRYLDADGNERSWRREDLARASGLSIPVIRSIEEGDCAELADHLQKLSDAFALGELERLQFYARASGYVYPTAIQQSNIDSIKAWLEQLGFPAAARTPLYDFLCFNAYHAALFGYNETKINKLRQGTGANLLRVLFAPEFEARKYLGRDRWESQAEQTIRTFRTLSFRYRDTRRYREILHGMRQYREFARLWHHVEEDFDGEVRVKAAPHPGPFVQVRDPADGFRSAIRFVSLRISQILLGHDADIAVYVPLAGGDARRYQALCENVPKTRNNRVKVYTFVQHSLEREEL
jgi:transcriptional regulator with XRE-family HTH domain